MIKSDLFSRHRTHLRFALWSHRVHNKAKKKKNKTTPHPFTKSPPNVEKYKFQYLCNNLVRIHLLYCANKLKLNNGEERKMKKKGLRN